LFPRFEEVYVIASNRPLSEYLQDLSEGTEEITAADLRKTNVNVPLPEKLVRVLDEKFGSDRAPILRGIMLFHLKDLGLLGDLAPHCEEDMNKGLRLLAQYCNKEDHSG
jgi:hypothetical protein